MQYQEILNASISMIGESGSMGNTADYSERAEYLLATFCGQCTSLDRAYRLSKGESSKDPTISACVDLNAAFPLNDVFVPAATYYLAAMLIMEENEDMGEMLFAQYSDLLSSIRKDLLATSHSIKNNYPLA